MSNTTTYDDEWINLKLTRSVSKPLTLVITVKAPKTSVGTEDKVIQLKSDRVVKLRDFMLQNI